MSVLATLFLLGASVVGLEDGEKAKTFAGVGASLPIYSGNGQVLDGPPAVHVLVEPINYSKLSFGLEAQYRPYLSSFRDADHLFRLGILTRYQLELTLSPWLGTGVGSGVLFANSSSMIDSPAVLLDAGVNLVQSQRAQFQVFMRNESYFLHSSNLNLSSGTLLHIYF
jgi:hypothetical protein